MPSDDDRYRTTRDESEPNKVSSYGLKYNDLEVILKLSENGVSLSEPHDVAYYLYASSEPTAEAIAAEATQRKFRTEIHRSPDGTGQWTVVCHRRVVLSKKYVAVVTNYFEQVAANFDADYDGWEVAV